MKKTKSLKLLSFPCECLICFYDDSYVDTILYSVYRDYFITEHGFIKRSFIKEWWCRQ